MKTGPLRYMDQLIAYEIHRKATVTRRVHLRAGPDGRLMVIAPQRISKRAVHKMLQDRAGKVARFLADAASRLQEMAGTEFIEGERHLYLGLPYPLKLSDAANCCETVQLAGGCIQITARDPSPAIIEKRLSAWYAEQADLHFNARLRTIAQLASWTGGTTPPLRLRKMKRTWGSCSAKGVITLNRKLIKAPETCIDYVIAHELCHLSEMNHGKAFYTLLESLYPEWRTARTHLRQNSHLYLQDL